MFKYYFIILDINQKKINFFLVIISKPYFYMLSLVLILKLIYYSYNLTFCFTLSTFRMSEFRLFDWIPFQILKMLLWWSFLCNIFRNILIFLRFICFTFLHVHIRLSPSYSFLFNILLFCLISLFSLQFPSFSSISFCFLQ